MLAIQIVPCRQEPTLSENRNLHRILSSGLCRIFTDLQRQADEDIAADTSATEIVTLKSTEEADNFSPDDEDPRRKFRSLLYIVRVAIRDVMMMQSANGNHSIKRDLLWTNRTC